MTKGNTVKARVDLRLHCNSVAGWLRKILMEVKEATIATIKASSSILRQDMSFTQFWLRTPKANHRLNLVHHSKLLTKRKKSK